MALIRMNFFSDALGMCVPATVILPRRTGEQTAQGVKHPVLWLLHGMSGDHADWTRYTAIERYVSGAGLAVVMPSAHQSRYMDMAHGGKFFTYIADELPGVMRAFFPLSDRREDNFVCGLSMGGAGSFRIGLTRPGNYAAIGCLSAGASNFRKERLDEDAAYARAVLLTFGNQDPSNELEEMRALARDAVARGQAPRVYHACGLDDQLLERARATRDFFESLPGNPFGYVYEEDPGAHTWDYWDAHIRRFLAFIGYPAGD